MGLFHHDDDDKKDDQANGADQAMGGMQPPADNTMGMGSMPGSSVNPGQPSNDMGGMGTGAPMGDAGMGTQPSMPQAPAGDAGANQPQPWTPDAPSAGGDSAAAPETPGGQPPAPGAEAPAPTDPSNGQPTNDQGNPNNW